ncbi:hypothetical protein FOC4_g10006659 [Fusarium odoratissimum]|uniref:C2H2-type domain-containing protein n=1 Tax=Fusarium oxysporum f. sp. cubense (strain race 4) TaxID=2502994 RepID=N1RQ94_FUSC4|nr:hypothetical protein FOC4_g10006659 [Fusarium odoratissimum]
MEGRSPDDGLLSMSEEDFVLDFASDDLDSLPWNAPYGTNDAAFADVHQETTFSDTVDSINSNSFDIYSDHINPILNNTQELPALDTTYFDILLMNWDFMAMPTDPITTTHAGSITTTEQSNCSTTYTSSSSPMTESSPIGLSQSQVSDPLSTKDAENVSITIARRRRTKMEPGTRPCDLKRQKRKEDKPEKCHICEKGHQWKRDLERHYRSNHPDEAAKMGLSRSKPIYRGFPGGAGGAGDPPSSSRMILATGGKARPARQTMEGRSPDDGLLSMSEEDFVLDFASDDLDSLPWNAPYGTNDAAFADVHQETTFSDTVDSINSNSFDIYSDHINPILNNTQELPALDTTYFDILLMNWDFMAMPTDPITTTHAGSITTTEQSNCSTTYTSSSSPMTESSPIGLSQSQVSDPLSTKDAENVSITIARRRRTKMEPGTRPCDLKRQKRKEDKPEKCHICEKGHQWKRDLERHYRSNHPDEAAKMGLTRSDKIVHVPSVVEALLVNAEDILSVMSLDDEPLQRAPEGYYVANECPNGAEQFTFTCPYIHCDGWIFVSAEDSDRDGLPGIQFYAGGKKGRCVNEKCPRFRFQFDSYGAMKQHSRSLGHVRAEEDLGLTDADESGEEVWKKSAVHGMEVAEDGLLWKCTKQGCKKFNVVIKGLGNAKSHYNSDTHLTAAEEIATSSDESVEHIEGMEFLKDGVWTCVKPGCKRINAIYQHLTSARKHANANFHALAEEPAEEILEDIEGMVVLDGESAYMCIKFGCKGSGKTYSNVRSAKLHANARPHMKAGDISAFMPNQFNMDLFATPTRTPRNLLLTPMETEESTIVVTPGSPSAGRGTNPAGHPAGARNGTSARTTKMIRLGRSSVTTAGSSKHEVLERKNRELESRVAKLEMQMGQVLGSQSPQIQNNAHYQNSQVHQSAQWFQQIPELPQAHETTCARVEGLSKFVRAAYRPKMSMPVNEDEL